MGGGRGRERRIERCTCIIYMKLCELMFLMHTITVKVQYSLCTLTLRTQVHISSKHMDVAYTIYYTVYMHCQYIQAKL